MWRLVALRRANPNDPEGRVRRIEKPYTSAWLARVAFEFERTHYHAIAASLQYLRVHEDPEVLDSFGSFEEQS